MLIQPVYLVALLIHSLSNFGLILLYALNQSSIAIGWMQVAAECMWFIGSDKATLFCVVMT